MDFSSFVTSVITSFLIFVVLMLIFAWLSRKPGNQVIYYPNRILKGLEIGSGSRNPISWIKEAISSKEDEIIAVSGVDTAVYFVYLSTGNFFFLSSVKFIFFSIMSKYEDIFILYFLRSN